MPFENRRYEFYPVKMTFVQITDFPFLNTYDGLLCPICDYCAWCGTQLDEKGLCSRCDYCSRCGSLWDNFGCCPVCDYCRDCGSAYDEKGLCPKCNYCQECGAILEPGNDCKDCGRKEQNAELILSPVDDQKSELVIEYGCSCAICRGAPNEDHIYKYRFGVRTTSHRSSRYEELRSVTQDIIQQERGEKNKYLAFDLEISKIIPENAKDWGKYRPYGISCAATLNSYGSAEVWFSTDEKGKPRNKMTNHDLIELVKYLQNAAQNGFTLLTWNGLGFDFDVLAEESGQWEVCRSLALNHIDMMFHIFCIKGFPLSLDKVAKGMGLAGKMSGIDGSQAPKIWAEGKYQLVEQYVAQDVKTTLEVAKAVERRCRITWTSQSGKVQAINLTEGWLKVCDAVKLPKPDTSCMSDPWKRSKFTDWVTATPKSQIKGQSKKIEEKERSLLEKFLDWFGNND